MKSNGGITVSVSSKSVSNVLNNLTKYDKETQAKLIKEVYRTANAVNKMAKERAPVLFGRLRSSLHVETKDKRAPRYSYPVGRAVYKKGVLKKKYITGIGAENSQLNIGIPVGAAAVGSSVVYAARQESKHRFLYKAALFEQLNFVNNINKIVNKVK